MRVLGLMLIGISGLSLTGCSQISSVFKKNPDAQADNGAVASAVVEAALRTPPEQTYQFSDQRFDVEIFDSAAVQDDEFQYSGGTEYIYASEDFDESEDYEYDDEGGEYFDYDVELYTSHEASHSKGYSDPRDAEFVKLNGDSNSADWQNCEKLNGGYLMISEYDFGLNPGFEVCMRNNGYVLASEYGQSAKPTLNAKSEGLRGVYPQVLNQAIPSELVR